MPDTEAAVVNDFLMERGLRGLAREYRSEAAVRRIARVATPHGLHMRKCLAIVQLVGRHQARVTIQKDDKCEDAASILGLMMLAAEQGEQIQLSATGPDAEEAIRAIIELLDTEIDAKPGTRVPWRPRLPR